MRSAIRDIDERLTPPRRLSLDEFIEYLGSDELLEVTPESLRVRKRVLDKREREREAKRRKDALSQA
jgi:GTP-binding protein